MNNLVDTNILKQHYINEAINVIGSSNISIDSYEAIYEASRVIDLYREKKISIRKANSILYKLSDRIENNNFLITVLPFEIFDSKIGRFVFFSLLSVFIFTVKAHLFNLLNVITILKNITLNFDLNTSREILIILRNSLDLNIFNYSFLDYCSFIFSKKRVDTTSLFNNRSIKDENIIIKITSHFLNLYTGGLLTSSYIRTEQILENMETEINNLFDIRDNFINVLGIFSKTTMFTYMIFTVRKLYRSYKGYKLLKNDSFTNRIY